MVKIAKDTPKELKDLLMQIDASALNKNNVESWVSVAKQYLGQYVFKRPESEKIVYESLNISSDYQQIFNVFNRYNFNFNPQGKKIFVTTKVLYMGIIHAWVKSNLPMK